MIDSIFREYDIRGVVGKELIIENVYDLGLAMCTFLKQKNNEETRLIIGYDARTHSLPIHEYLVEAAIHFGFEVIDVGLCPTPVVYFACATLNVKNALMVTASHNPKEYNGIKIYNCYGQQIQKIKDIFKSKAFTKSISKGSYIKKQIINSYIDHIKDQFNNLKNFSCNAVIDCGNGAAGTVVPQIIEALSLKNIKLLYEKPDGNFPNHEADPTVLENMLTVRSCLEQDNNLTVGIGFDGDADRMNPMTKSGELVAGDKLLALFAQNILKDFPKATVVYDIKGSAGLHELLLKWDAKPIMAPSGHSYIKSAMNDNKAILGGELSCHFFFADKYFGFDDGIYAALRLLEIFKESGKSFEQLLEIFPKKENSKELRIKCDSDASKIEIVNKVKHCFSQKEDVKLVKIDGIKVFTNYGWGLLRVSNTQPFISLRFESDNKDGLKKIKQDFYNELLPFFDKSILQEQLL